LTVIVKVEMINCDTGKTEVLHEKNDKKRCSFMKTFVYDNRYEIQLRLDNNYKPTVPPTLDADIKDLQTGKFLQEKSFQHHTDKKYDPNLNMDIYDFRFKGLIMRLYTVATAEASLKSNFYLVDSLRFTLTRGT
jgi:hypothetical protein